MRLKETIIVKVTIHRAADCSLLMNKMSFWGDDEVVYKNYPKRDGQAGLRRLEPIQGKAKVVCLIGEWQGI